MRPRTKKFGKRFLSLFLSLAICATLLPTIALAEDAELIKFKNMTMNVLRNDDPVAHYDYASKNNDLIKSFCFNQEDTWMDLSFVISYSQEVSLELYRLKDSYVEIDADGKKHTKLESRIELDSPETNYGGDLPEKFLDGASLGYLNGVRFTGNIDGDETDDQVSYVTVSDCDRTEAIANAVRGENPDRTTMKDEYVYGFEGLSYEAWKAQQGDAAFLILGKAANAQDTVEPEPEQEIVDTDQTTEPEKDTEPEQWVPGNTEESEPTKETESAEVQEPEENTENAAETETATETVSLLLNDDIPVEEPSDSADEIQVNTEQKDDIDAASTDEIEQDTEPSKAEATDTSVIDELEVDEADAETVQKEYGDLAKEEAVLLGSTDSHNRPMRAPEKNPTQGNTIQNIFFWDGQVANSKGATPHKPVLEAGYYVIVMTPTNSATKPYNSFLAFEVIDEENPEDTFQDLASYEDIIEALAGDPVNLLTGSFSWNYTDFSLYGGYNLPFTRYYESKDARNDHGMGLGWSTDYSVYLNIEELYAQVFMPQGNRITFALDFDGTYRESGDYVLLETSAGYAMQVKSGKTWYFDDAGKLTSIVTTDGSTTICEYSGDKLVSISNDAGSFTLSYAENHVVKVTDNTGRSIKLTYDGEYLSSVENPDSDSLRYSYENGFLKTVENFEGKVYVDNTYDALGRVVHQYAEGFGTFDYSYDYDTRHNVCTGTDGYFEEIWYDAFGFITKHTDSSGTEAFEYDNRMQLVSQMDREGNTTVYEYDDDGNVVKITYADDTYERFEYDGNHQVTWMRDRNGSESSYTYDDHTHMTSSTDGRGNTTRYTYDSDGNMTSVTNALNETISYTYDANGNCTAMTDALGNTTRYVYDGQGRLVSATDANGGVTNYEYTTAGKLVKITDADGNVQTYEVNGNGFNTVESDWMGNLTRYTYDTQSNVTSITDPLNNVTYYTYDERGNLSTTTDANGHTTSYIYDASGRMISMTDANGNVWTYSYNNESQMTSVTDPTGGKVTTSYDEVGRTTSTKDANGNTTRYTYDGVGNTTKVTDALSHSTSYEYDENGNLTATTDRNGHTTRYTYDEENRLTSTTDAEGNTTSYTYDANGQMTKTSSAMGVETSSTYDALGRQISSTDALGHVTSYEYDVLGRATKITYADGGFVAYTYDANGQVLTATDELGGVTSYIYDANGQLTSVTDAMGGVTAYAYDAVGNVTSVTDAMGGVTAYTYDKVGNIASVTDANGNTTSYSYDALGRAVAVTDANGGVTRAEYDHKGNIVKAVDAEGNVTTYVYDALDRLTSYTNAEGYTFSFQYDNEGNTVASTDGNGNTTRYTYDGLNRAVSSTNAEGNTAYNTYDADGRMVKSVNEEGAETAYAYDADGRLISMTDALGNVTAFEYDSRDRVIKVTDAKGNATTFTYDLAGNVKSETNAKGVVTSYAYDANGNLTSMTDAAGTVTYIYDALNRVTSVKDRRGNTQFFTYDATDRIVQVKDRNGNATQYVYDGNGNIVKTIDALGTESVFTYNKNDQLISTDLHRVDALNGVDSHEITLYEYDGRNLVTKEINALGDSTVYVYDGNGNLVSKTDADGYVTQYSYTALDLVKKINYNGAKEVSYQYNKVGELVQMDDWTGTNTFELDLLGRLRKMTDHKGNTVSYTYDAVGNQTGITYPDGSKTRSFYDAVYNLTSVIDADDGTYAYVYDDANRPVKLTYPNGWIEQYTYDAEGNLLKTVDTDPFQLYNKTPKVKYEYTYDAEGNVLTEFQRDSDATENLKSRTAFTYDALNRLTGSTRKLEVYPYDTLAYTYTYDTLGNLLKQSGPTKGEEDTYQYNDLNQMVSKHVCGYEQKLTRIYDYGYTYDKRGNLVKEEEICSPTTTGPKNITIATYLYDETNRMVQGTNKTGEVSAYTFNGLGVRVGTELILEDNSHGYTDFHCQTPSVETGIEKPEVVKTDYVIDYTRLGIDQRVLVKSEQDGYDFRYTYGLDKVKVYTTSEGSDWWGQSIHKCVNAAYVHTDRLGSVVNLSDEHGRVTARADYTDWGEVRRYTDITVDQGFRRLLPEITYATHEYDDVLNQFYAKARMYDAENKRFTAGDSILDPSKYDLREYVTNPMQLAQYLYVKNNAVNRIDPTGKVAEELQLFLNGYGWTTVGDLKSQGVRWANWENLLFSGVQAKLEDTGVSNIEDETLRILLTDTIIYGEAQSLQIEFAGLYEASGSLISTARVIHNTLDPLYTQYEVPASSKTAEFVNGLFAAFGAGVNAGLNFATWEASVDSHFIDTGKNVWKLKPMERGAIIDDAAGNNLGRTFPIIDTWDKASNTITSIKSYDIASSYAKPNSWFNKLRCHINSVGNVTKNITYQGQTVLVNAATKKELMVVVPNQVMSLSHRQELLRAFTYAKEKGVKIILQVAN